jgi:predicted NBD/HSP70 family sugar kinase
MIKANAKGIRGRTATGSSWVAGVDLGASNLRFARADLRGRIQAVAAEPLRAERGPAGVVAQIKAGIARLEGTRAGRRASVERTSRLAAVAVGVPSAVDPKTGRVSLANNLPGWRDVDLGGALEKELGVPVVVENDANLAAIGEHWRGVARGVANFVFVALGTGIGAGIFIDGELHRGRTGNAGELFRLNVDWPRWEESRGDVGYFENQVAGLAIARAGRETLGSSRHQSGRSEHDARFVFQAYHRGDSRARAVIEHAFTVLGVGVANLVSVLDPELIVFGGGLSRGDPQLLLRTVRKVVRRIHPDIAPSLKLSALGDRAQIQGAIFSALTLGTRAV